MNMPLAEFSSAPVRSRPDVSTDKRRGEEKNPPVPPQAVALASDPVPLEVRRLRVANGSRRQRDLAAVRMAEELEVLELREAQVSDCRAELAAIIAVRRRLRAAIPTSTYRLWIKPLRPAGTIDSSTLVLSAPEGIRAWAERRYSHLITEALEGTGFKRVVFVSAGGEG